MSKSEVQLLAEAHLESQRMALDELMGDAKVLLDSARADAEASAQDLASLAASVEMLSESMQDLASKLEIETATCRSCREHAAIAEIQAEDATDLESALALINEVKAKLNRAR